MTQSSNLKLTSTRRDFWLFLKDALVTKNMVVGESVYGEKRISVDTEDGGKTEYRVWNPFRSKVGCCNLITVLIAV